MKLLKYIQLLGLAVVIAFSVSSCTTQAMVSGGAKLLQAATLSDAEIQAYVKTYVDYYDAQNKVLPENNAYTQRLRRITNGITQVDGTPLNFKVYQTSDVNAFACADGSVRVYTGLLDLMTDDEVLGVVGHEIGHVGLKHSKKQFQQALVSAAVREGLVSTGGVVGALSASQLGDVAESLASSHFSRQQESQSDDYGYNFLVQNGKNPWAMAMAFEKLQALENNANTAAAVNNLFSSHPDIESRIKTMSDRATKDGYKRPAATSNKSTGKTTTKSSTKK